MAEWITIGVCFLGNFALLVKTYIRVGDLWTWKNETVDKHIKDDVVHLEKSTLANITTQFNHVERRFDRIELKLDHVIDDIRARPSKDA